MNPAKVWMSSLELASIDGRAIIRQALKTTAVRQTKRLCPQHFYYRLQFALHGFLPTAPTKQPRWRSRRLLFALKRCSMDQSWLTWLF
jgi:hypothetical protein